MITADLWRGKCLGCAGSDHPAMMPHLNQLDEELDEYALKGVNPYAWRGLMRYGQ